MEIWQTEAFKAWWEYDWSWAGLAVRGRRRSLGQRRDKKLGTLQDVWRDEADKLIAFGQNKDGSPRLWTRYHLPPCDRTGGACPAAIWTDAKSNLPGAPRPILPAREMPDDDALAKDFANAFTDYADFSGFVFRDEFYVAERTLIADFSGAIFMGGIRLSDKTVGVRFKSALFGGDARFRGTSFLGEANFEDAEFRKVARFKGAVFPGDARFGNATFAGGATFESAKFAAEARFGGATFKMPATFRAPRIAVFDFVGAMDFSDATFESQVEFSGREFLAKPDFSRARFEGPALFHGARLHPETTFAPTVYGEPAAAVKKANGWFKDRTSGDPTWLTAWRRTVFYRGFPFALRWPLMRPLRLMLDRKTFDVDLAVQKAAAAWFDDPARGGQGRGIHLRRAVFERLPFALRWPGMKPLRDHVDREMNRHELAFRTLRLAFAENGNIEYEMMFYGLELDARRARGSIPFLFEGLFAWLYKITSGYGQNMLGPLLWFLGIWGAVIVLLAGIVETGSAPPHPLAEVLPNISDWVLQKLVPLPIWAEGNDMAKQAHDALTAKWLPALWAFRGLETLLTLLLPTASLGLLTVFLIALRRRFQIDRG